jgi:glycosyltransferase involved in cell wall biosynthesis
MKVAFPYPAYWPHSRRGVERCIHDLAGYLARHGHQVHVVTSGPGRPRVVEEAGVKVSYLPQLAHPLVWRYRHMMAMHVFGLRAARLLAADPPDVMHVWSCAYLTAAPLLKRRHGIRSLMHFVMREERTGLDRLNHRAQVRSADLRAGLTEDMARSAEVEFGRPCAVLPPPVDMDTFKPSAPRDPARPIVFFAADMGDPRKGGSLLLRAWNRVHRECPRATLVVGGPFGLAGMLSYDFWRPMLGRIDLVEEPAARAAIEVRGPGELDELPVWYSQAAVTVLPSYDEAFGMVLTESLACGTPVVASSAGGPGEIVSSPDVGATVPIRQASDLESPAVADQLAEAILAAIELSGRAETGSRCREWASRWSLDRVGRLEERLLEAALSGSAGRPDLQPGSGEPSSAVEAPKS